MLFEPKKCSNMFSSNVEKKEKASKTEKGTN